MFGRGPAARKVAVGEQLGPYLLQVELGSGGMGVVFRAVDTRSGHIVALKLLRPEYSRDAVLRRRFEHEARAAGAAQGGRLVRVLDVGETQGYHFLVMTYIPGRSLEARLADEALRPAELVGVAVDVGSALDALHAQGVAHRDVKPTNILLDCEGGAWLTDFGLAKGADYTVLTKLGHVMGTLDYLAPELVRGGPATPATDLYALGCVLYECVSGQPPFGTRGVAEVGRAHLQEIPADPCAGRPDMPPAVGRVLLRVLAKQPELRPPSGASLAAALRAATLS